jgi:hypothetical protein
MRTESRICDEKGAVEGGLNLGKDAGAVIEVTLNERDVGFGGKLLCSEGRGVPGQGED